MPSKTSTKPVRHKRVHGHLVSLFSVAAVALVLLNVAVVLTPPGRVLASADHNVAGWAWSDTGGWLSMNSINSGAGGGDHGVHVDPVTKIMNGFAWSSNKGWVCFGTSCATSGCADASNTPAGSAPTASIDGSNRLRGWAMVCNLGAPDGWISLNCLDTGGAGSCATSNYGSTVNFATGDFSQGFAWHGLSGAAGWGWIQLDSVTMSAVSEGVDIPSCHDNVDNDLDGDVDCADNACFQEPSLNCPALEVQCALLGRTDCCSNGFDDDLDGDVDCSDNNCNADPLCVAEICDNEIDDNGNSDVDCEDSQCNGFPACTPAWIQSQYGNLYSQEGVGGNAPPPGQSNASFCISSGGTITNFTSESGCLEPSTASLDLPTGGNGYVTNLGRLDVAGILAGRYGQVVNINGAGALPTSLDGKVYVYDRDVQGGVCPSGTDFVLDARTFLNASGETGRGNGLLVIKGCDLRISGNLGYQGAGVSQYLRNLASFGVLTLTKYSGGAPVSGGNIAVDSSVGQIVGLYFAEQSFSSGSTGGAFTDVPLDVFGAIVSRDIQFERRYGSPTDPAEDVVFDGRGVVNPPPGTQDITKSLPTVRDTF